MSLEAKRILVVGANGALGTLLTRELAKRGAIVIGTARSNESGAALPPELSESLLLDLESQSSIETLTNYLNSAPAALDGVVNAAGRVGFGSLAETSAQNASSLMQINHLGPAEVISRLLPKLAESESGAFVLSISGVVAEKVFPGMAAYTASKTAHSAWLKALALEARRAKIRVIDARPGHTETGLATRPLFGTAPAFAQGLSPENVAKVMVDAIESGITDLPSDSFTV